MSQGDETEKIRNAHLVKCGSIQPSFLQSEEAVASDVCFDVISQCEPILPHLHSLWGVEKKMKHNWVLVGDHRGVPGDTGTCWTWTP